MQPLTLMVGWVRPQEVHNDPPEMAVLFGVDEEGIDLVPESEWGGEWNGPSMAPSFTSMAT